MAPYSYDPVQTWPGLRQRPTLLFVFLWRDAARRVGAGRGPDFFKKNIATGLSGTAQRHGRGTGGKTKKKGGGRG